MRRAFEIDVLRCPRCETRLTADIRVSRETPTLVTWDAEPKPKRYDVIRGDVANLGFGPGGTVDLGTVVCIEDDSTDLGTAGHEDVVAPGPGQVLFFLYRGSQGVADGPGSYGSPDSGERVAGAATAAEPPRRAILPVTGRRAAG